MSEANFHTPNDDELEFLRLVTVGYPELQVQVESCQIDDYDATGYCDVRVTSGQQFLSATMCGGPSLREEQGFINVILWIRDRGYLDCVEIVAYVGQAVNVYSRFIKAGRASTLKFESGSDSFGSQ